MRNAMTRRASVLTFSLVAWLVGVWWLSNQFVNLSLNSDGLFYAGDAVRLLVPQNFTKDVFFLSQTQGDFSLFGWCYSHLIAAVGLLPAEWGMSTLGRLWWCSGAMALAYRLWCGTAERSPWWIGLALMLLLPSGYDSERMFFYGTADVTPRTWAEAWVLWSLACRLSGHWGWSVGFLGAALAFHPLMALPGLGLQVLLLPRWRWLWALVALSGAGLLGAALKVGPLAALFQTFDPLWWECVVILAGQVLIASWSSLALAKAACMAALLLATAAWHPAPRLRRWAGALLGLEGLMLALWWLGCVTHNVLLLQLQLWRVLWLCQLLAPALWWSALPPWRQWSAWHGAQAALVAAAVLSNSPATVWLFIPGVFLQWPRVVKALQSAGVRRVVLGGAVAALCMSLALRFPEFVARARIHQLGGLVDGFWVGVAQEPMWTLPVLGLLAWGHNRWRASRWRLWVSAVAVLPVAGLLVGLFGAQFKAISRPLPDVAALRRVVPPGALIYWNHDLNASWLLLRQGHYVSAFQGAVALFSREAAMEYRRRLAHLAAAGGLGEGLSRQDIEQVALHASPYTVEADIGTLSPLSVLRARLDDVESQHRPLDTDSVRALCRDPVLDRVLVSGSRLDATWSVPYPGVPGGVVSVFQCER